MTNLIIIAVVAAILAGVSAYIYREKKRGAVCIGCSGNCSCCRGCSAGKSMK